MARLELTNLLCEPRLDVALRTRSRQRLTSWVTLTGVCTVCACRRAALVVRGIRMRAVRVANLRNTDTGKANGIPGLTRDLWPFRATVSSA
jgi:hypothetical protein